MHSPGFQFVPRNPSDAGLRAPQKHQRLRCPVRSLLLRHRRVKSGRLLMDDVRSQFRDSEILRNKLAEFAANEDFLHRGRTWVERGELRLGPFQPVTTTGAPDWEDDPFNNRNWQWRLNWFSFLPFCIAMHARDIEESALDIAAGAVSNWLDRYLRTGLDQSFEFAWHDHATALRAEQLALLVAYVLRSAPEWFAAHQEFIDRCIEACQVHARYL